MASKAALLTSKTPMMGRVLTRADGPAINELLARDPVANVFVAGRLAEPKSSNAALWGYEIGGELTSLCFVAANLVPVAADSAAIEAFARRAAYQGRTCSSILGPLAQVRELWQRLSPYWGVPRDIRSSQPLLATSQVPQIVADPHVRLAHLGDLNSLEPAAVAMYTEEVGVNPLLHDGGMALRRRLAYLVQAQRVYVRMDHDEVIFKAEIGSVGLGVCQVQGVWVHPAWRRRGMGTAAMAAVTTDALRRVAGTVSLYVNDFNTPARAMYERCGYQRVGEFATVLF